MYFTRNLASVFNVDPPVDGMLFTEDANHELGLPDEVIRDRIMIVAGDLNGVDQRLHMDFKGLRPNRMKTSIGQSCRPESFIKVLDFDEWVHFPHNFCVPGQVGFYHSYCKHRTQSLFVLSV